MSLLSRRIEIYDFYRGTRHWRVTGGQRPAIVEAQTYGVLRGLKRNRLTDSFEEGRNALELTVPGSFDLLDLFRPYPPTVRIHVNMKRVRVSDSFVEGAWMGVISDVDDAHPQWSTIRCQSLASAMQSGRGGVWQVPCWKPLGWVHPELGCNVNLEDFKEPGTLSSVAGINIEAAALALHGDGWFNGGFVRWLVPGSNDFDYAFIVGQVGTAAILLTPMPLPNGSAVEFFPGCDHSLGTCHDKFNNAINHGGIHTWPDRNVFNEVVF